MKLIIEVRMKIKGATPDAEALTLAEIERDDHDLTKFGLSLAEGRKLACGGSVGADGAPSLLVASGRDVLPTLPHAAAAQG